MTAAERQKIIAHGDQPWERENIKPKAPAGATARKKKQY